MRTRLIQSSWIRKCPKTSLLPDHYREDGSCRCDEKGAAKELYDRLRAQADAKKAQIDAEVAEAYDRWRTA